MQHVDKNLGPNFVHKYYRDYLHDPLKLLEMYHKNAVFSHGDVNTSVAGADVAAFATGTDQIHEQLRLIKESQTNQMKVQIVHLDALPSHSNSVLVLTGGYFLMPQCTCRFVHTFVLVPQGHLNYVIMNDCLRLYSKHDAAIINNYQAYEEGTGDQVGEEDEAGEVTNEAVAAQQPARDEWSEEVKGEEEEEEDDGKQSGSRNYAAVVRTNKKSTGGNSGEAQKRPKATTPTPQPVKEPKAPKNTNTPAAPTNTTSNSTPKDPNTVHTDDGTTATSRGGPAHFCAILKNLPTNSADSDILNMLEPHVHVTALRNNTAQGKTFAFVNFDDPALIEVIAAKGLSLRGQKVDIEFAHDKYATPGPGWPQRRGPGGASGRGRQNNGGGNRRSQQQPGGDGPTTATAPAPTTTNGGGGGRRQGQGRGGAGSDAGTNEAKGE
eukprot:PhF_6_TR32996/c2_g1_i1/m.48613